MKKNKEIKENKKVLAFCGCMLAAVIVIIVIGLNACIKGRNKGDEADASAAADETAISGEAAADGETSADGESTLAAGETADDETADAADAADSESGASNGGSTEIKVGPVLGANVFVEQSDGTSSEASGTTSEISLPYDLGDGIQLTKVGGYNGVFIEDGSDADISNVAAIAIQNTGSVNVEYAEVTIKQAGQTWTFTYSDLPAGGRIVVMEANKATYAEGIIESASQTIAAIDSYPMSEDQITVTENSDSSLTVKNISGKDIPCVRVFYKYKMAENTFVGGITYTAKITDLAAGEERNVTPSHYSYGSSQVMMVRTFDTAD